MHNCAEATMLGGKDTAIVVGTTTVGMVGAVAWALRLQLQL